MAVHASSVIALWVDTYNHDFYVALTNQEEYFYNEADLVGPEALTAAIDAFTDLMTAMTAWKNASAPSRTKQALNPIANYLYSYNMYKERFGMAGVADSVLDAKQVFDMGGFPATVIARAVSYYDDLTEDPITPLTYESVKVTADIDSIAPAIWQPLEKTKLDAIEDASAGAVRNLNSTALFDGFPTPPEGVAPKTKQETAEWIYLTLHWKWVVDTFPAAVMTIPASITSPP